MDAYCEVEGLAGLGLRAYDDISDLDEDTYDSRKGLECGSSHFGIIEPAGSQSGS